METGKPGLVSAPVHISSIAAQTEKRMDIQAPLTAVYIHTVPALPAQPFPQPPAAARESPALHLAMPPLYSKDTLPFLTLHIAGGLQSQPGLSLAAAAPAARPKSAGKHVCPHCGRDCMKPSVLEKHLRCHTGERPYPCTVCGVSFKTQSNLYKHKRTQAHARLSSESEQSSLGSLDSMSNSRETYTSSLSVEEHGEEPGCLEKDASLPAAEISSPTRTAKVCSGKTPGSTGDQNELTPTSQNPGPHEKPTRDDEKQKKENENPVLPASRHLPLQRQEATLFSKQWKSSVSRGKSQSHESTDSGFSEISDHYPSPSSVLPDHSMDSLTESTKEHLLDTHTHSDPGQGNQESKDNAREQEQKILEERISKLISQNSAVVEDKQLENVRPRKTVLSKQGSIDLPMPYTYKDSFHFDMRINKTQSVGLQRNKKPGFYNSVPTQHSMTMEHTPLTRSNSLPFSVTFLQPERSSPTTPYQSDYVTLVRRGSSGQINPTGFAIKPMNHQSSTHRPLVRQTAVDCNHATDGLFKNSSVEEACTSSLSCDGGDGDICAEPSNRKFRRKKAQKFAYNKWYMYGGGTFKKLYDDKGGDGSVVKGRKSLTTPEHEVIQGLQKRLSTGHKETGTITGSMQNLTSNTATVCHPGCPPTRPPPVPGVEFNLKSAQFHSSCNPLRMPLRRNLSLSTLPLPSIGSLVTHTTDSISRTEAGRVINEGKHTDSTAQFGGAHIPSDRKKQKTDDKMVCPQEMETDPNTLTHPPPSVTAGVPQQDTKLTYINIQTNQNHAQLKAALFPACIINANAPSASTSPASSIPTAAKTSFLPKYQLKLPNASESDSNPSSQVGNKPTGSDGSNFTSVLPSTVKTLPSETTSEQQCSDPINTPLTQPCASNFSSTQLVLPSAATTPSCQADAPGLSQKVTSSPAVAHKLFAATTKTTACLQDFQAGLCSTMEGSSPVKTTVQLLKPVASEAKNTPATSTITTEPNQSCHAASAGFSQAQPNPPPHINASISSGQSSQLNAVTTCSNSPLIPCHIVPFDSGQPVAQNVFHVHTADLQICLQIISDEQLALIEPQIERQAGSRISQTCEMEVMAGGTRNKAQSFDTTQSTNEERDCEQLGLQREINQSKSLPTLNMDNIKPPVSVRLENAQPNIPMTQATAECESPEGPALSIHPHKYSHITMDAEPRNYAGEVTSTAASLKGVKAGGSPTSEKEHALPVNCSAEEQFLPDRRVSQGEAIPPTLPGQHKLCPENTTCISFSSEKECNSELPVEESQPKPRNQGSLCSANKMKTVAHQSSRSEDDDARLFVPVGAAQAFSATCTSEHSWSASSFSISNGRTPRQLNTQASIYSISPVECTLSETLNSSKYVNSGYEQVLDSPAPSQEISLSKSEDFISSAPSEQQPAQVTSVSCSIQVEGPKDIPAELKTIPNPDTGFLDGASPGGRAAQKEQQTQGDGGAPGPSDSTEQRPQQSQEVRETNQQCMEGQGSSREEKNGGMESDNCTYILLPDMINPEGEVRKVQPDSSPNSLLSEQHLQHLSQTHSGMSEYPPQSPQQVPGMSNTLKFPTSSAQVSPNLTQPSLEVGNVCLSQHWESATHHQQEPCQRTDGPAQPTEPQAGSYSEPDFRQTFSHVEQQQECKKSSVAPPAQRPGEDGAITGCSLESGAPRGLLLDVKPSSSAAQISHISLCDQIHTVMDDLRGETLLGSSSTRSSKTFMYAEPDTDDRQEYSTHSSSSGRADITNKYQSFFFASQLQSYPPADCLSGAVRPVQSCQDYPEDTSSSDDEGKLIIEL